MQIQTNSKLFVHVNHKYKKVENASKVFTIQKTTIGSLANYIIDMTTYNQYHYRRRLNDILRNKIDYKSAAILTPFSHRLQKIR